MTRGVVLYALLCLGCSEMWQRGAAATTIGLAGGYAIAVACDPADDDPADPNDGCGDDRYITNPLIIAGLSLLTWILFEVQIDIDSSKRRAAWREEEAAQEEERRERQEERERKREYEQSRCEGQARRDSSESCYAQCRERLGGAPCASRRDECLSVSRDEEDRRICRSTFDACVANRASGDAMSSCTSSCQNDATEKDCNQ